MKLMAMLLISYYNMKNFVIFKRPGNNLPAGVNYNVNRRIWNFPLPVLQSDRMVTMFNPLVRFRITKQKLFSVPHQTIHTFVFLLF